MPPAASYPLSLHDALPISYDEGSSSVAARLWFMLRAFGHEKVSVLDGGLRAWSEAGLPLTGEERSEEHTSELQSRGHLVCRLLLEKKKGVSATEAERVYR